MKHIRETGIESVISKKLSMSVMCALMIFIILISIGPFVVLIVNATRTDAQIAGTVTLIPGTNSLDNYRVMQEFIDFPRHVVNSLFIAATGAIFACYFGALAGYALAKLNFRGRNIIFIIVLVSIMMPWQLGIIGFYTMIAKAGFLDSYLPIILPAIGSPLVIFFLKQYIGNHVPDELIEAARIEGVSEIKLFNMIILPLSIPALVTMGILSFVNLK